MVQTLPSSKEGTRERTFCHTGLQAGIESVSGKERDQAWLAFETVVIAVVIADCLEPGDASSGLGGAGLDMIDVVVVKNAEVRRA